LVISPAPSPLQREREELQTELREAQIQVRELKADLKMLEEQAQRDAEMASDTILDLERDIEELKRRSSDTQRLLDEQVEVLVGCDAIPYASLSR
jgi:chromosome segregation ATPase